MMYLVTNLIALLSSDFLLLVVNISSKFPMNHLAHPCSVHTRVDNVHGYRRTIKTEFVQIVENEPYL
jgi:hypothetical protein